MNFDLIDEPWLPCITSAGQRKQVGLREALAEAHDLMTLRDTSPLVTAALHRVLLALLHRAFDGPRSEDDWRQFYGGGRFDAGVIDTYLGKWSRRFDLFDDAHPFYQVGGFEVLSGKSKRASPTPATKMMHEIAGGNNPTLFDHTFDSEGRPLSPAQSARALVTAQAFGLGGLAGGGRPNFKHAPLVRGVMTLLRGHTLFETLMLNLLIYDDDEPIEGQRLQEDSPAWERDAPTRLRERKCTGYLDLLTWQSRRVRLLPEDRGVRWMFYAPGEGFPSRGASVARPPDPMWFYRLDDDEMAVVRLSQDRALWRNSDSLFAFSAQNRHRDQRPLAFQQAAYLKGDGSLTQSDLWRCALLGLATNPERAADVKRWAHEDLPVPSELLEDENLVNLLRAGLQKSESTGSCLRGALDCLAQNLLKPAKPPNPWPKLSKQQRQDAAQIRDSLQGLPRFWGSLELPFKRFLCDLPKNPEPAVAQWLDQAKWQARRAFGEAASSAMGNGARELRARVAAEGYLKNQLAKITVEPEGGDT